LDGVLIDAEEFKEAAAEEVKEDDDEKGNDHFSKDDFPLPLGGDPFQKGDVERNVSDGIHKEKKGEGNRKEAHNLIVRLIRICFNPVPKSLHEGFLGVVEVVKGDETVRVFVEGGFGPVGGAGDEGLFVDPDEFVVEKLDAAA
jgi:hypothetical protein